MEHTAGEGDLAWPSELLELALLTRAAEALRAAGDGARARQYADRALACAEGQGGTLSADQPLLVGDVEVARALLVSAEVRLSTSAAEQDAGKVTNIPIAVHS